MRARLCVHDFVTCKYFSFNNFYNKGFCVFWGESYFIKAIETFFPMFVYNDINTRNTLISVRVHTKNSIHF